MGPPAPSRRSRSLANLILSVALAVTLGLGSAPGASASAGRSIEGPSRNAAPYPSWCTNSSAYLARADALLADRYELPPHRVVSLPHDPRWNEDPLHDRNWQFQYHAMRYVLDLLKAWQATGRTTYRDRALWLLRDWARDNPRHGAPSPFSWNDHSTALRAVVYACAAQLTPMTTWLRSALDLHGRTLADEGFYVRIGNHALNQSLGLLEVGRALRRWDWMRLARDRLSALVLRSVDAQGVSNEQAVFYQAYNRTRYRLAEDRLRAVGLQPGPGFARVTLMPRFLALATLPNGEYEMIGDTEATRLLSIPGTWAEFVATAGAHGPKPPVTMAFADGYLFARSGWGEHRAFADETFLSVRWGDPPRTVHGHPDGTAVTLFAWGTRLLVDPGKWTFNHDAWRTFFTSRRAHDVVVVDGLTWQRSAPSVRLSRTQTSRYVDLRLATDGYAGVHQVRRVTWSRRLDYLIVEDRLTSSQPRTFRQLWHLVEGSAPTVGVSTVVTHRARGNVLIRELVGRPDLRIVSGRTDPIQGWISYHYGTRVAAPVVEAVRHGSEVTYLTLIVPAKGSPVVDVAGLRSTARGYAVTISIGGHSERVVAVGSSITITPLD